MLWNVISISLLHASRNQANGLFDWIPLTNINGDHLKLYNIYQASKEKEIKAYSIHRQKLPLFVGDLHLIQPHFFLTSSRTQYHPPRSTRYPIHPPIVCMNQRQAYTPNKPRSNLT